MGVGAMTDARPAAEGQPAHPAAGGGGAVHLHATVLGALTLNYFGDINPGFTLPRGRRPSGLSAARTADGPIYRIRASWPRNCWGR